MRFQTAKQFAKFIAKNGLSVSGYLSLSGCTGLTALPEGLSVSGSLDLSGCTGLDRRVWDDPR